MNSTSGPARTVTVIEHPDLVPLCPHCERELTSISTRQLATSGSAAFSFGKRHIYACPHCHKALGISHRKGFWMG